MSILIFFLFFFLIYLVFIFYSSNKALAFHIGSVLKDFSRYIFIHNKRGKDLEHFTYWRRILAMHMTSKQQVFFFWWPLWFSIEKSKSLNLEASQIALNNRLNTAYPKVASPKVKKKIQCVISYESGLMWPSSNLVQNMESGFLKGFRRCNGSWRMYMRFF